MQTPVQGRNWQGALAALLLAAFLPLGAAAQAPGAYGQAADPAPDALSDAIDSALGSLSGDRLRASGGDDVPVIGAARALPPVIEAERSGANALLAGGGAVPDPAMPAIPRMPVVVELFTSQGCSNCPPVDALMGDLVRRPDVLPLTFNVDYWDYLGWPDSFARPQYTQRQEGYAAAAGERAVYTPQMIVDGQDTALTIRPAELMSLVDAHRASPAMLSLVPQRDGARLTVDLQPLSDLRGPFAVMMVGYVPERTVAVTAGENSGRSITYRNVVVSLRKLADWDGRQSLRLTITPGQEASPDLPPDTRDAVLVQQVLGQGLPGPIMAAMRLD